MNGEVVKEIAKLEKEKKNLIEVNGKTYSTNQYYEVYSEYRPPALKVSSLYAIVDYLEKNIDKLKLDELLIIIESYNEVNLISNINGTNKARNCYLNCKYDNDHDNMKYYQGHEEFLINLRTNFAFTDDMGKILTYISKLKIDDSMEYADDGITQKASVKKGISGALTDKQSLPSIVSLAQYKTFKEIEPLRSEYLFRVRNGGNQNIECALFPSDGKLWQHKYKLDIKSWLQEKIKNVAIIG